MFKEVDPNRAKGSVRNGPSNIDPEDSGSAEDKIIKELRGNTPKQKIEACSILEQCENRGLDFELLSRIAIEPLITTIVTDQDQRVRDAAHNALVQFMPELSNASNRFRMDLANRTEQLASSSEYKFARAGSKGMTLPYAEHLVTATLLLCDMIRRAEMAQPGEDLTDQFRFAKLALDGRFGGAVITQSADALAALRTRLPFNLKIAQEELDRLFAADVISSRLVIAPGIAARAVKTKEKVPEPAEPKAGASEPIDQTPVDPQSQDSGPSTSDPEVPEVEDPHIQRRNALMRMLHSFDSVDKAIAVVQELSEIGKEYCIQAIRQAAQGGLSSRGFHLSYASRDEEQKFKRACADAIKKIEERTAGKGQTKS